MVRMKATLPTSFTKQLQLVGSDNGKKCMSRAINDALKTAKTSTKRNISKKYTIKQKDVAQTISIEKAKPSNLKGGKVVLESRLLTVGTSTHFSITPRQYTSQKGVKIKRRKTATATIVRGQKKKLPHAFIANPAAVNGGNTMLWLRLNKGIAPMKTLSVPQMASNEEVYEKIHKDMIETYEKRLDHYEELLQKKAGGK